MNAESFFNSMKNMVESLIDERMDEQKPLDQPKEYLRPAEAAKYLSVSRSTFWHWTQLPNFTARRIVIGDVAVYKRSELDAFMESNKVKP